MLFASVLFNFRLLLASFNVTEAVWKAKTTVNVNVNMKNTHIFTRAVAVLAGGYIFMVAAIDVRTVIFCYEVA